MRGGSVPHLCVTVGKELRVVGLAACAEAVDPLRLVLAPLDGDGEHIDGKLVGPVGVDEHRDPIRKRLSRSL